MQIRTSSQKDRAMDVMRREEIEDLIRRVERLRDRLVHSHADASHLLKRLTQNEESSGLATPTGVHPGPGPGGQ